MTNSERIAKIEKQRSIGKLKYILLHGVLGWGLGVAVFVILFDLLILKNQISTADSIFRFILYPVLGIGFGDAMWELSGRKLNKLKKITPS